MEKKTVWMALISGLVAGLLAAMIICTMCCNVSIKKAPMPLYPARMELVKPKAHHNKGPRMGFHHKKGFHQFKEPTPEMKERFAQKLGLSDEQKATLEQYRTEDMAKMKPLFDEMEKIKGKIEELRKANRARFESVLTDEQKEILKQMKAEHKKHGFKPRRDFRPDEAPSVEPAASDTPAAEAETTAEAVAEAAAAVEALAE